VLHLHQKCPDGFVCKVVLHPRQDVLVHQPSYRLEPVGEREVAESALHGVLFVIESGHRNLL
jgi:hypothetical protein